VLLGDLTMEKAMPEMVPSTDFMLDDRAANRRKHNALFPKLSEILIEDERNLFYRVGNNREGWYAGFDKKMGLLYYLVHYERASSFIGKPITQTQIWRWHTNLFAQGITERVVFEILIPKFGSIMSDEYHTPDGKRFWESLLARAERRKHYYGLLNLKTKDVFLPEINETVQDFLDRVSSEAWGDSEKFQNMRFIISKTRI